MKKSNGANKGQAIFALIFGIAFLTWFFSTRDYRSIDERMQDEAEESLRQSRIDERIAESRNELHKNLISDTKKLLNSSGVAFLDIGIAESGCLWVYMDVHKNQDRLAESLCKLAKKDFVSCVTILDPQSGTLGRAHCN